MYSPVLGLRIASVIFGMIALGHLLRILLGIRIVCGSHYVQQRWSLAALIICAALCCWLWMIACKAIKPAEAPKEAPVSPPPTA